MTQHPALEFLRNLDSSADATFNIEHYTDLPKGEKKPKPDPLGGRHANLTLAGLEALLPALHAVNEKGAGIFVARNQCTGHRSEDNVSRTQLPLHLPCSQPDVKMTQGRGTTWPLLLVRVTFQSTRCKQVTGWTSKW